MAPAVSKCSLRLKSRFCTKQHAGFTLPNNLEALGMSLEKPNDNAAAAKPIEAKKTK